MGAEAPEGAVQEVEVKQEVIEAAAAELEEQGLSRWFTDEDGVEREMTDAEWCWANRGNKKLTAGAFRRSDMARLSLCGAVCRVSQ